MTQRLGALLVALVIALGVTAVAYPQIGRTISRSEERDDRMEDRRDSRRDRLEDRRDKREDQLEERQDERLEQRDD